LQLGLCSWAFAVGPLQLGLCSWAFAVGPLQLGLCSWAFAVGPLQLGAPFLAVFARVGLFSSRHYLDHFSLNSFFHRGVW
jgi:hypothetical protein